VRSRSKPERINLKMGAAQSEGGEDKKIFVEGKGRGKWGVYSCFAKVYSCFSRARGTTKDISFFIRLIGFKG
jgi:hypothetical protein